jgi:hypothetical protein
VVLGSFESFPATLQWLAGVFDDAWFKQCACGGREPKGEFTMVGLGTGLRTLAKGIGAAGAASGAIYGGMQLAVRLYADQIKATPEQQNTALPGDDLVPEPGAMRMTQVADLNAPTDEVWKHIYQLHPAKAGFYSFTFFEKMFGMSVDNMYNIQPEYQEPDAYAPGDLFAWSYAGWGCEVADMVPGKYVVWYADSRDPTWTPGGSFILTPLMDFTKWNYTYALEPLDGGQRTRLYCRWNIVVGPNTNRIAAFLMGLIINEGGQIMNKRLTEKVEASARHEEPKPLLMRLYAELMGRAYATDPRLQKRYPYPQIRYSRDFPRVASIRAPFTEDPNWPPQPGTDYTPDIAANNAKKGWTAETPRKNDRVAAQRQRDVMREYGIER